MTDSIKPTKNSKRLGIISVCMIPISVIGSLVFLLIFMSAPIGIVTGVIAARRGRKVLGITGAVINALLLCGLLVLWLLAATSKVD